MNCIILAAGYSTRLQADLNKSGNNKLIGFPKALLPIGKSCIFDILLSWIPQSTNIVIVTNSIYYEKFRNHLKDKEHIKIIDDKTSKPEERLGSIGDLLLGMKHLPEGDFILLGSDTIFNIAFDEMEEIFLKKNANLHLAYTDNSKDISKKGVIEANEEGKIIGFEEKPSKPKTQIAGIPVYFIKKETIPFIKEYDSKHSDKMDRLGDLISFLIKKTPWFVVISKQIAYDVGDLETYQKLLDGKK
ncbi:MAG: sugar phosphate nucleotidyltransferase [Candidatus Diapherotrites archaeon]